MTGSIGSRSTGDCSFGAKRRRRGPTPAQGAAGAEGQRETLGTKASLQRKPARGDPKAKMVARLMVEAWMRIVGKARSLFVKLETQCV